MKKTGTWFAMLAILSMGPLGAHAGVGDIDIAFGQSGRLDYPSGFGGLTELPDGSLQLVAVKAGEVQVRRLDSRGRPLAQFGNAGLRTTAVDTVAARVLRGLPAPDGSSYMLVLAGLGAVTVQDSPSSYSIYASNEARILKLTPDGAPDPAFGAQGFHAFVAGVVPRANLSIVDFAVIAPDGALYVSVGYHVDYYEECLRHSVFRLRPDGALDTAFGVAGEYRGTRGLCGDDASGSLISLADGSLLIGPPARLRLDATGHAQSMPTAWQQSFDSTALRSLAVTSSGISTASVVDAQKLQVDLARWREDLTPLDQWTLQLDSVVPGLPAGSSISSALLYRSTQGRALLELGVNTPQPFANSAWPGFATLLLQLNDSGVVDAGFGARGVVTGLNASGYVAQREGGVIVDRYQEAIRLSALAADSPGGLDASLPCGVAQSVPETAGSLRVTVLRHLGSSGPVSVRYRLRSLEATAGADFGDVAGTLSWADGESGGKVFQIPVYNDTVPEPFEERFQVLFDSVAGGAVLGCPVAEIMIISSGPTASAGSNAPVTQISANGSGATAADGGGGSLHGLTLLLLLVLDAGAWRRRYSRSFSR